MRSLARSIVRVAIMAGTLQPKPTKSGTKALPGSPSARIRRSITNAARAMYPDSSKMAKNRNMKKTTGMKVEMVCRPPPIPLDRKTVSHSGVPQEARSCPRPSTKIPPTKISKKSMKTAPKFWVKRKVTYMINKKIGNPIQRFKMMRSIRSVNVPVTSPSRTTTFSAIRETNS